MATTRASQDLDALRFRFDGALQTFLAGRRADFAETDPRAAALVDQIVRLVGAGGRRFRPAFVYWGFRAGGGEDGDPIVRAAASLELVHTMAIIHDDLIDGAAERRGVPTVHVDAGAGDVDGLGRAVAVVTGDLAAVLADELLVDSGFAPPAVTAALARSYRMRREMAAGQLVDLTGGMRDARVLAGLKGGGYTVAWPLRIGAALAGAGAALEDDLRAFGEPLGAAFQLLDDLRDGDAAPGVDTAAVDALAAEADAALERAGLPSLARTALGDLATLMVRP